MKSPGKTRTPADPAATTFLNEVGARFSARDVRAHVDALAGLRVAVVGETILDEYVYCNAMGKSGKEPMLVMRYLSQELHAGGAVAVANHVAEFCERVDLVTCLGEIDPHEEFVRAHLRANITPHLLEKANSPTIIKRRYVDQYSDARLFGMYRIDDSPLQARDEAALIAQLEPLLDACDVIIVADYGHGMITDAIVRLLCGRARFLAVNTQINSANAGFHTVSRYPRADYVCLHEGEARLDARSPRGDLRAIVSDLARRLSAKAVMITRGKLGTLLYQPGDGFHECPALAGQVVDRTGAGDAVLSLTSLSVARGGDPDVVGLLGNLAGAQAVSIVGNCTSIRRSRLIGDVENLLTQARPRRAIA